MMAKACTRCHIVQPDAEYLPCESAEDGLQAWCIECIREHRIERRRRQVAR